MERIGAGNRRKIIVCQSTSRDKYKCVSINVLDYRFRGNDRNDRIENM